MSSNIYNRESPDIPDENMYDPASTSFEAISENTRLELYNPESPEINMENLSPNNSKAVDPFESCTDDDFPEIQSQRNEAKQNDNLTTNSSQPKLNQNMKQPDQTW
ncbi:hypothetical protein HI914_01314 [Erysiphe necator]|nr:hypothetical protein HI914_01314 [Erysiphe necator]